MALLARFKAQIITLAAETAKILTTVATTISTQCSKMQTQATTLATQ